MSGLAPALAAAEAGADGVRVEAIVTAAELEQLGPEWERLWTRAPRATPFQSPHWLLPWWRHIGRGVPACLALRGPATGELVALAALYRYRDGASGPRQLLPMGVATTDELGMLALPGWEARAAAAVVSRLARAPDWDVLEWPQLRAGDALLGQAPPPGWRREIAPGEPSPVLALPGQGAAPVPRAMAANIRASRHRAARAGGVTHELADDRSWPEFLEALFRLHASRWSLRGLPGVLAAEDVRAMHAEAAPRLQAAGLLRLHGLRWRGELIAVLYCLADAARTGERRHFYYLGGFDARWRALGPGTLLIAEAIEQARAEGAAAFDFLRGAEPYKYRWGAVDQAMYTLRLWPGTVSAPS